jgi:endonuclease G
MKKLLLTLLLAVSTAAFGWTQRPPLAVEQCRVHAPWGFPVTSGVQPLCQQAYLVGYDAPAKLPKFVSYELLPKNALGCVPRTNAFATNQYIPGGATPDDYAATGYDRGHMVPDGDLSWDVQVEFESFLMSNMAPQAGSLNRGIWKLLETSVRGWVVQTGQPYVIYAGSVYGPGDKKIGSGVVVPHAFYKVVVNAATGEVAGWWFPHVAPYPNLGNDLTKFRKPVAMIQSEAGVSFSFPAGATELRPGAEWKVDYGKLTNQKRARCKNPAADANE